MPKSRYTIMRQTLGARGTLAHNMMQGTATVQVSLDWRDEADCARKMNAASRLAPVLLALYANSPLVEGAPSGYLSFRSHVWSDVDPARCGYPPCTLDGSFSYRRYIEWALDAPMLFLRRGGKYLDPKQTFRQFLVRGFEGPAMWSDWVDHLSTLFPEVRIKKVLEFRSADSGDGAMAGALAAVLRGLLYDPAALSALEAALPKLSVAEHLALHQRAQRQGLKAEVGRTTLAPIASEVITIAERGLKALGAPQDAALLAPLAAIAASGITRAEQTLRLWEAKADPLAVLERAQV
jgi:glutamate--cysteine ligase